MANRRSIDLETQLKEIRRQLSDQLSCLDFRAESKLSLLSEFQEFYKRRGEVEYEYARSLERLCERFEKSTKQRNIRTEVRSTFNLWSTVLAETRKKSRERAAYAEVLASEMLMRLEIMVKDVHTLAKKCKDMCIEVQDQFLKELRDFSEQTKVYQISCHNTTEAHTKLAKAREKRDAVRGSSARRKKAQEKAMERQRHYKAQRHLLMKNRNDYILGITKCNSFAMQYFNMDIMDVVEYMDFDYHTSFQRLANAHREAEREACEAVLACADNMVEQGRSLNFETDLHYFLSEYSSAFTPPNPFTFTSFPGDNVTAYKVNTEDVFRRAKKTVEELTEEKQTLEIQREEDVKTVAHMEQVNLKKYQVTTVDDALAVLEENGDNAPSDNLKDSRGTASLDRGLSLSSRGGQAILMSQKGKKDTLFFTLQVVHRRIHRSDRLALVYAQLDILEKSLDEQKVPPVSVVVDEHGHSIPGEVPKLFGGSCLDYIMATGCDIPLIVQSCVRAIEREGLKMEGLFRVPGPAAYTEELRKAFEEGRDPLAGRKVDVAAVASVLKSYFRELSVPLFPTTDYAKFIKCTRHEDPQMRMDLIRDTVNSLHPAVITVMRFLFKFLNKVGQYSFDNKMSTANLALVFGPTLTRAPDELDPRQLTNDVPSINMLIQMCIDRYDYIFGEEDDEEEALREGSTSPPPRTPTPPPDLPVEHNIPPPPLPERAPQAMALGEQLEKVEELEQPLEPPPPPPSQPHHLDSYGPSEPAREEPPVAITAEEKEEEEEEEPQPMALVTQPMAALTPLGVQQHENGMQHQVSGASLSHDLSTLDETLKDLEDFQASLEAGVEGVGDEGGGEERGGGDGGEKKRGEGRTKRMMSLGEEDDEDEDSSDEEGVIEAVALYDYTARSDKEVSFQRGEVLQVIEKTPDHNWWDGFHGVRRGFIPVAYVEIKELYMPQVGSPVTIPSHLRPAPPLRKSSMPSEEHETLLTSPKVSDPPQEATIAEERRTPDLLASHPPEVERVLSPEGSVTSPVAEPEMKEPPELNLAPSTPQEPSKPLDAGPPERKGSESSSEPPKPEEVPASPKKPPVPVGSGAVRSLTQQFQDPQQQRVLVEPHTHHRRQGSDVPGGLKKPPDQEALNRSASGGNKVSMLSSAFEHKPAPPPPIRPKPHQLHPHQLQPHQSSGTEAGAFTIMPHSQLPGASPLQKAALVSQVGTAPPRKPAPPPTSKPAIAKPPKGSFKVKREKSKKEEKRPPLAVKPPVHPFAPASAQADRTPELLKEMLARRKAHDDH